MAAALLSSCSNWMAAALQGQPASVELPESTSFDGWAEAFDMAARTQVPHGTTFPQIRLPPRHREGRRVNTLHGYCGQISNQHMVPGIDIYSSGVPVADYTAETFAGYGPTQRR